MAFCWQIFFKKKKNNDNDKICVVWTEPNAQISK